MTGRSIAVIPNEPWTWGSTTSIPAHSYWNGHSEEIYGEVLPQFRRQVFITTKSVKRTRREAEAELHLSLKRLRTSYVDLWQIHSVSELDEIDRILGPGGAMEAFEAAKKAGKCRFIGFTGHRDPHVQRGHCSRPIRDSTPS